MIYTRDLPSSDPMTNQRLGYALPTSILLAPYLATNPYYVEYTDAIDEVFERLVYSKMRAFSQIRNMWVGNADVEAFVMNEEMVPFSAWSIPERELLVKQVNFLGMKLGNSGVVGDQAYLAISRFLGQYWLEKGRYTCIDFLNFCLGTDMSVVPLWTQDYKVFVAEGDPEIGTPVWEGGTWYPTTHTAVVAKNGLEIDPQLLTTFFYDISNYNLVLWSIDQNYDFHIGTEDTPDAAVVAIALHCHNEIAISTESPLGSDPPDMNAFDWVSTQFYSNVGTNIEYFLGQPSGWMTHEGHKVPVYGKDYRALTYASTLPTRCYGDGKILCGSRLVWVQPPGSPHSKARVPAYIPERYLASVAGFVQEFVSDYLDHIKVVEGGHVVTDVIEVPGNPDLVITEYVNGIHPRGYVGVSPIPLTSPLGFVEIYPHLFTPYW